MFAFAVGVRRIQQEHVLFFVSTFKEHRMSVVTDVETASIVFEHCGRRFWLEGLENIAYQSKAFVVLG